MEIRMLQKQELLPALHLVWEVFAEDIAPSYTPEGVAEFQKFIRYDNMLSMFERGEVLCFGAFENGELRGTMAVRSTGHICLFYVKKDYQGKGIGHKLFSAGCDYCANRLRVNRITVHAAPGAVAKYHHMGMRQTDAEQNVNGIRYVPMEMPVGTAAWQDPQPKKNHTGLIIGGIIAGILALILMAFVGTRLIMKLYDKVEHTVEEKTDPEDDSDDPMNPDSPLWDERDDYGDDSGDQTASGLSGVAAIPEYVADDLPYEIREDDYTYTDDEKQSTIIAFQVKFPKLQGLDDKVQKTINEEIKTCAMDTVEKIYENPSEEFKEKVLGTENPMLTSYVTYKVCYANKDFISIIFEDEGTEGSQEDYYQHLRTLNIGLKDGKVYEVKDIVKLNDDFSEEWLDEMRDETENSNFLSELDEEEIISTLGGKDIDGNYVVNFFVDKDGIEIGYDLNYGTGDPADLGYSWVTAPFSFDEIEEYKSDKEFWGYLE